MSATMDARLQRRIQRYGWERAADAYERHWHGPLAGVHGELLARAAPAPGEAVLDVACGAGVVSAAAARAVGPAGRVLGVDLAEAMVQASRQRAQSLGLEHARFERMDAEQLALPDAGFNVALCALGLMYVPDPGAALRELHRVLRPGGRAVLAVWGERARCGWAQLFGIVDAEVRSEVCPLFFGLGQGDALARSCASAGLQVTAQRRRSDSLDYADAEAACAAAFAGGPVALAWSRFDAAVRERVQARYLAAIEPWRDGRGYRVPAEYLIVAAQRPEASVPVVHAAGGERRRQ
ncbi:MAG TPA: methyltransferase domain-containing protein [Caldimonas sp.]|nr:methyltransferase domain-containing protein [Caldimonas sp.]HEX2541444.1 methyltransferase domain-containing protein [Caldimonas sp.]